MSQLVERTGLFTTTQLYEPSHADVLPPAPMLTEFAPILPEEGPITGYGRSVLKDHLTLERRMLALEEITDKVAAYCKMLSTELPRKLKSKIAKQTQEIVEQKVLRQQEEMLARITVLEQRFDSVAGNLEKLLAHVSKSKNDSPEYQSAPITDQSNAFMTPRPRRNNTPQSHARPDNTPSVNRGKREPLSTIATASRSGQRCEISLAEMNELHSLGNEVNDIEAFTSTIDVDKDGSSVQQRENNMNSAELMPITSSLVSMPPAVPPVTAAAGKRPSSGNRTYKAYPRPSTVASYGASTTLTTSGLGSGTLTQPYSYRSRANFSATSVSSTAPEQSLLMHIGNQSITDKPVSSRIFPTVEAARTFEMIPGMSDDESSASSALVPPCVSQSDDPFTYLGSSLRTAYVRDTSPILTGKGTRSSTQAWLTSTSPTGTRAPSTEGQRIIKSRTSSRPSELPLARQAGLPSGKI